MYVCGNELAVRVVQAAGVGSECSQVVLMLYMRVVSGNCDEGGLRSSDRDFNLRFLFPSLQ
jgi:hypothetical protein